MGKLYSIYPTMEVFNLETVVHACFKRLISANEHSNYICAFDCLCLLNQNHDEARPLANIDLITVHEKMLYDTDDEYVYFFLYLVDLYFDDQFQLQEYCIISGMCTRMVEILYLGDERVK